jgi:hypothetical protein
MFRDRLVKVDDEMDAPPAASAILFSAGNG